MNLLLLLARHSRRTVLVVAATGLVSGLASAGLLVIINKKLAAAGGPYELLLVGFVGLATLKVLSGMVSMLQLAVLSQEIIIKLVKDITAKILKTPFRALEEKGTPHILTILTDGVLAISWATQSFPAIVKNLAILAGCGVYLAWISPVALGLLIAIVGLGIALYQILNHRALQMNLCAMQQRERVHRSFSALTGGIKELLLHRARREEFLRRDIGETVAAWRNACLEARKQHVWGDIATQVLLYGLIASVIFLFPFAISLTPEAVTAYVFTLLYMLNPIWAILGSLPSISQGQAALSHFEDLHISLSQKVVNLDVPQGPRVATATVELKNLVFTYTGEAAAERGFTLGPLSFELAPGELIFLVGGNGSGKSTFIKVLTGLYVPLAGEIWLNGTRVDGRTIEDYRESFSAVFSDSYVFDRLFGVTVQELDEVANDYLRMLDLADKVRIHNGTFSTTALSQGQRKRLALVTAYLENRPVYVFDEWAADQDPQYKEVFYTKLLPGLTRQGKAVVVVTHDDRYFYMGHRVIKLQDGQIVDISTGPRFKRGRVHPIA